jgi:hypothetical protein
MIDSGHTAANVLDENEILGDDDAVLIYSEVSHQAVFDDFVYFYLQNEHKCTRLSENAKDEIFEKLTPDNYISASEICAIICNDPESVT